MKGIKKLFTGLIFSAFAIVSINSAVFARGDRAMIIEIPFDFYVKSEKLSAGRYDLMKNTEKIFVLRSVETGRQILLVGQFSLDTKDDEPERIIFNRYGEQYFLRGLYWNRTAAGRDIGESKAERKVRKESSDENRIAESAKPKAVSVLLGK